MTIAFRAADLTPCDACAAVPPDEQCPVRCERRFVTSTWSSSFKGAHAAGMIWHEDWAAIMHRQISRVLERDGARTIVCYESKAPAFLYGFICGDVTNASRPIVFYTYVKEPYRRAGYARGLFAELGVDLLQAFTYACKTGMSSKLADKAPLARWDPRVVRYPKPGETAHEQPRSSREPEARREDVTEEAGRGVLRRRHSAR